MRLGESRLCIFKPAATAPDSISVKWPVIVNIAVTAPIRRIPRYHLHHSFCDCMKRSNVASVNRNQRFWSERNFR
jgi:hypothetical protein